MPNDTRVEPRHPAKYSPAIMGVLVDLLVDAPGPILDPFAGVGRIFAMCDDLGRDDAMGIELEPEFAAGEPRVIVGDCLATLGAMANASVGTICTSPTYGNRMADTYLGENDTCPECGGLASAETCDRCGGTGRASSRGAGYAVSLGRAPSHGSSAAMQWGPLYREFHRKVWAQCARVLQPRGTLILNMSDHIRWGERQMVTDWHLRTLMNERFRYVEAHTVSTPRSRRGANHHLRVEGEQVIVLEAPTAQGVLL